MPRDSLHRQTDRLGRLKRAELVPPVADLDPARFRIWVCTRCLNQEHELPASTRHQLEALRAGKWPTPGMRDVWPHNCSCGGVLREIEVMVKPGHWECPGCRVDLGAPECEDCEAEAVA
jgi:hypothetical protein